MLSREPGYLCSVGESYLLIGTVPPILALRYDAHNKIFHFTANNEKKTLFFNEKLVLAILLQFMEFEGVRKFKALWKLKFKALWKFCSP